ncbi:MAG: ATP-binding cassette domain-containing protein [Spirochaetes bacterium]|nr:ATP-binding cassette domain-containing protein [Spirochaetota bacterium]
MALLGIHEVHYHIAGEALLEGVSLHVEPGDRITLVGRNGTGKSTLLRIASGELIPDEGRVSLQSGAHLAYLPQQIPHGLAGAAIDVAAGGTAGGGAGGTAGAAGDAARGDDHENAPDAETLAARWLGAEQFLTRLGVDAGTDLATASGGVIRRVLLARTLAAGADALLLDEPTNHLDIDTVLWLEDYLLRLAGVEKRAIIMVTHDRALARRFTTRVAELDRGRLYLAETDYDEFVRRREAQLEQEEAERREFDKKLAAEQAWYDKGVKARRTRDEGRVRRLEAMREEHRRRRERQGTARMSIETARRSGTIVIETEDLTFSYGETPIVSGLSTLIERGDRLGIVGPNGSGKTTLVRLLLGELEPDRGTVRHGTGLEVVYFDQMRAGIDPEKSIYDNVGGGYDSVRYHGRERHLIGYLKEFLFTPEEMKKPAKGISGGETNRLLLAKLFARPSNVLVLDEPTNDLDVETLELLEQLLIDYEGTIILVSHDREFLDNVVTECLVLPGTDDGRVIEYSGGYSDWREEEAARLRSGGGGTGGGGKPGGGAANAGGFGAEVAGAKRKPKTEKPRRLSYREQRELEALPDRIAELEAEQAELHERLQDPALYRGDAGTEAGTEDAGSAVRELTERLAALEKEIADAYRRWEELESVT